MHFADRLDSAVERFRNPCLIGLDPHPDSLPDEFTAARDSTATREEKARDVTSFLCQVIDLIAGRVPAVKPQSAFFETYGPAGAKAWEDVIAHAHSRGLLVIGDVKRGDIDSTARAYARAFLESGDATSCDAVTVNPYLGSDSIAPFLESCRRTGRGIYVLVRTSNPGSKLFQEHGTPPLYERVADAVAEWGTELVGASGLSSVGAVVGATHPHELARLRERMPSTPFLIPGYGAQGAGAADIAGGFLARGRGAIVNSSRGILFAYKQPLYRGRHWKDALNAALDSMIVEITGAIGVEAR
jgi:orotidine-5'-phosphate decarboxylase